MAVRLSVQSPSIFTASLLACLDASKKISRSARLVHDFPYLILDFCVKAISCYVPEARIHLANSFPVT